MKKYSSPSDEEMMAFKKKMEEHSVKIGILPGLGANLDRTYKVFTGKDTYSIYVVSEGSRPGEIILTDKGSSDRRVKRAIVYVRDRDQWFFEVKRKWLPRKRTPCTIALDTPSSLLSLTASDDMKAIAKNLTKLVNNPPRVPDEVDKLANAFLVAQLCQMRFIDTCLKNRSDDYLRDYNMLLNFSNWYFTRYIEPLKRMEEYIAESKSRF